MSSRLYRELRSIAHPYMFILREGTGIHRDLLDYSLQMLQVNCKEVLRAPKPAPCEVSLVARLVSNVAAPLTEAEGEPAPQPKQKKHLHS